MVILRFVLLLFIYGCATKYIVPANRFITPESQGGFFKGEFEFQKTTATQIAAKAAEGDFDEGVVYGNISRSGFSFSYSFFESVDLITSHVGGGNLLGGFKYQILGNSKSAKGAGQKLALVALFGGNDYQTEDKSVIFRLDAQELLMSYGYRFSEFVMPYLSLSRSRYDFNGIISSSIPIIDGKEPNYQTIIWSLNAGGEFNWQSFFLRTEFSYQQIKTENTQTYNPINLGISLGVNW